VKRFVLLVVLAAIASGAAAPSAQRTAVVPAGVGIGGIRLGGLTSEEARNAITWWYNRPLRFTFLRKHWNVRPAALGATVDADDAVAQALKARPQDATVALSGLRPVIHPGKTGLELNRERTVRTIQGALALARRHGVSPSARTVAPSVTSSSFGAVVVIYRGSNELHLYNGSQPWRTFQVATGQAVYPTPLGSWHVADMQRNPWWRPPDSDWAKGLKPIPPGPGNPLGTRWMGLDAAGVGMHGTPDAASIGYSASHGCIRMRIPDAEWLFGHVHIGTPVFIVDA
jgi:lipoprotein-anchoring transpeptidase ErfK/SrfK